MHQEGKERDEEQEVVPLQILEGEEGRSQQCLVEEDQREKRRQTQFFEAGSVSKHKIPLWRGI